MSEHKSEHSKRRLRKKDNDKCKSNSSSSDSDSEADCDNFDELYCYYKKHLLQDPALMIAGASTYANLYNTDILQKIPINAPLTESLFGPTKNVDHPTPNGPVYVRESGTYLIVYSIETDQPCQFAVYVNGVLKPNTVLGTNSGSGQLVSRQTLVLEKDDHVIVRNHTSGVLNGAVDIIQFAGGTGIQANVQFVLTKIAPHQRYWCQTDRRQHNKVHDKQKELYCRLEKKLLCDPELQLEGIDAYGKFFTQSAQTVSIGAPVLFDKCTDTLCIKHVNGTGDVIVEKSGVYNIYAMVATNQVAQFTIFVNANPLPQSTVGINRGASQLTSRVLVELKKGDVITWRNHTTAIPVTLAINPGGIVAATNAEIQLTRIAPLCADEKKEKCNPCDKWVYCEPEKVRCFKEWLLCNKRLQIEGSSLISVRSTTPQNLVTYAPTVWETDILERNLILEQGKIEIHVCKDGEYVIESHVISSQPDQFVIYLNGKPIQLSTTGQDSGSAALNLHYILALCKGDCLTFNNGQSLVSPVITSLNAGGTEVGTNAHWIFYRLGRRQEKNKEKCDDDCKPQKH